jgi:non-heme chloroperoxidase
MTHITTKDGARIFYKDWGPRDAQPIVFHHGWPLSADDWDNQMMFFLGEGFRVIAHDRRGHGRSDQTDHGNEMDTYASDVADLVDGLDLKNAVHVGHSTGGGEVARYVARSIPGRVAMAVLIDAVPPVMVRKPSNPAERRSRCSMDIGRRSRPTAPNSTSISPAARSTASTLLERKCQKA